MTINQTDKSAAGLSSKSIFRSTGPERWMIPEKSPA